MNNTINVSEKIITYVPTYLPSYSIHTWHLHMRFIVFTLRYRIWSIAVRDIELGMTSFGLKLTYSIWFSLLILFTQLYLTIKIPATLWVRQCGISDWATPSDQWVGGWPIFFCTPSVPLFPGILFYTICSVPFAVSPKAHRQHLHPNSIPFHFIPSHNIPPPT